MKDSPTPFAWILYLRMEGKKIRNNTTNEGYIEWSEDHSHLQCKNFHLTMDGLRAFVYEELDQLKAEVILCYVWMILLIRPSLIYQLSRKMLITTK